MEGYTKKVTPKGYTRYYKDGKAVGKKEVPARVVEFLGGPPEGGSQRRKQTSTKKDVESNVVFDEPEIIGPKNEEGILYSSPVYDSYEFTYNEFGERDFYYRGKKTKKIPSDILEILNEVDDELDFFHLIDRRVGSRKKASVWVDIVKKGEGDFELYYIYKDWEIPGDRIPRRMLSQVRYIDQDMADEYQSWKEEVKTSKIPEIEASRLEQLESARETLNVRLMAEKEEKDRKKAEEARIKAQQLQELFGEQERLKQEWQDVVNRAEEKTPKYRGPWVDPNEYESSSEEEEDQHRS